MRKKALTGDSPRGKRLACVEGQVTGVRKMGVKRGGTAWTSSRGSPPTRAATDQIGIEFLTHHMRDCANGSGCRTGKPSELSKGGWKNLERRSRGWSNSAG